MSDKGANKLHNIFGKVPIILFNISCYEHKFVPSQYIK